MSDTQILIGKSGKENIYWDYKKDKNLFIIGETGSGAQIVRDTVINAITKCNILGIIYGIDYTKSELGPCQSIIKNILYGITSDESLFYLELELKANSTTSPIFIIIPDVQCFWFEDLAYKENKFIELSNRHENIHLVLCSRAFFNTRADYAKKYKDNSLFVMIGDLNFYTKGFFYPNLFELPEVDRKVRGEGIINIDGKPKKFNAQYDLAKSLYDWVDDCVGEKKK